MIMKGWGMAEAWREEGWGQRGRSIVLPCCTHSCPPRLLAQRQQHSFGLHGVACVGTEAHLSLCSLEFYRANDTTRCPGGAPAVVSCVPGPLYAASSGQKKQQQSKPQGEVCDSDSNLPHPRWRSPQPSQPLTKHSPDL